MKLVITYEHGLTTNSFGGGQRVLIELLNIFLENHTVLLITQGESKEKLPIKLKNKNNLKIRYIKRSSNIVLCGFKIFLCAFDQILKNKKIHVISFTSEIFWLSILKKFKNFKLSAYLQAPDLDGFEKFSLIEYFKTIRKRLELYLFMLGFKYSDIKIANGNRIRLQTESLFNIQDIKTIFPGVSELPFKSNYNSSDKNLEILYIGRIELNQKPLTELFDCLINAKFTWEKIHIVGEGPDKTFLMNKYKNKRFIFYGSKSLESITEIINYCDVAILPSNNDSFMLTAYEMIKMGLPIICNDVADLKMNLAHLKTVKIIPNNSVSYQEAIINLINNRFTYDDCKFASEYISRNYNWKNLANALTN